jgi:hypothetical protein
MPKPYHLFISYASEDEPYATKLQESLRYWGLKVWFAPLSLVIGDKLLDSINAGLIASEYGVILLSPAYISKSWTKYELDVLHRQHIEHNKKLFPLWHGVDKSQIDAWNPGLSGIVALKSVAGEFAISEKIANVVYQGAPTRGVAPSYEDPQWRFLQGRGELLANNQEGGAFNLFEAAEFPDEWFPLYVKDRQYSKKEIVSAVASALFHGSHDEIRLMSSRRDRMLALCKQYGFDIEAPGFDAAVDCIHY